MPDATLTHLYFLLDRSGSMQSIKADTEGGFDAFIGEQRAAAGECRVTLAQFDNTYDIVYRDMPIADVAPLELAPRGSTALLDSMGTLITTAGEALTALSEDDRPGTVIVAIMTDGHENASHEWTHPAIKKLVEQQTSQYEWQFLYLGADQDAIEVGTSLGVAAGQSISYSRGKVAETLSATSANVRDYRAARLASSSAPMPTFSQDQRDRSR